MNPIFFGDSFDLVKRFFCGEFRALGYEVRVDPMFTGEWRESKHQFFCLIGARPLDETSPKTTRRALFFDPDTGVDNKGSARHVSTERLARETSNHELVFSFDQSFSRQLKQREVMTSKLAALNERGCHGMYYDSHARFLFVSRRAQLLDELHAHLVSLGLPATRLLRHDESLPQL
jgi:hypothetical protein